MARKFENRVRYYSRGRTELTVYFPEDEIKCRYCPFCRAEEALGRFWCRLTNDMIYNPYSELGDKCPLEITKNQEE